MKLPSNFNSCSICLREIELTWEHIIPESIGGSLESDIQCSDCNNTLGTKIVSKAKQNYPVRLAIRSLRTTLPALFNAIEEGQLYTGIDTEGEAENLLFKRGTLKTVSHKTEEGILNVDQSVTVEKINSMLSKEGLKPEQVEKALGTFEQVSPNKPVQLSETYSAIKRKYKDVYQTPGDVDMDERNIMLIAYNYLCIMFGELVFDSLFNDVRSFITSQIQSTEQFEINQIPYTHDYQPYHSIFYEAHPEQLRIEIVLFGSIVYQVTFHKMTAHRDLNFVYIEDLKNARLLFANTLNDVKQRNFRTNKSIS